MGGHPSAIPQPANRLPEGRMPKGQRPCGRPEQDYSNHPLYGCMARGGHGLLKVSSGPAMPYPSTPCGRATPETSRIFWNPPPVQKHRLGEEGARNHEGADIQTRSLQADRRRRLPGLLLHLPLLAEGHHAGTSSGRQVYK
jgi:hypothetical protein